MIAGKSAKNKKDKRAASKKQLSSNKPPKRYAKRSGRKIPRSISNKADTPFEPKVNTGWIVRAVIVVTTVAIGLSIYFGIQAKRRYAQTTAEQEQAAAEADSQVGLTCSGLLPLSDGKYAFYFTNDEGTFKTTDFNFSTDGTLIDLNGNTLSTTLLAPGATNFQVKVISGSGVETPFLKGESITKFIYTDSFTQSIGSFVLATPTDNNGGNEVAGIWFGTKTKSTSGNNNVSNWTTSLNLPVPPEGWHYAAWFIKGDAYYLIGRFTVTTQSDENKTYYTSTGPGIVGEDFLTATATVATPEISDVRSDESLVVITLEPVWFSESSPFPVAILAAPIEATTQPGVAITLELATDSSPYCIVQ